MTQKAYRQSEVESQNAHTQSISTADEIEKILRKTTGWFVGSQLFVTPMKTYDHPILLGESGASGSYNESLRPGLRVVLPKSLAAADVILLQERNAICFTVDDVFNSLPTVRETSNVEYDLIGRNPAPIQINPDRATGRLHVVEAVRTQEHGLLRPADSDLQQRMIELWGHMSEDQTMRLQLPAAALYHVSATLGRLSAAAA